jgi:3-deoxy-D-manno-octulosonic-acid transferase
MILFFYNMALLAALVLGAPWWLWRMATTQKYREGLLERLGFVRLGLKRMGQTDGAQRSQAQGSEAAKALVWIHAVSVGEVLAVAWSRRWTRNSPTASSPSPPPHAPVRLWPASGSGPTASSIARWTCPGRCGPI